MNAEPRPADVEIGLPNAKVNGSGREIVLSGERLTDVNTLDEPLNLSPVEHTVRGTSSRFNHVFQPYSYTVLRCRAGRNRGDLRDLGGYRLCVRLKRTAGMFVEPLTNAGGQRVQWVGG